MRMDFRNIFDVIGRKIVNDLRELMMRQTHVSGGVYARLKPSTIAQKRRLAISMQDVERRMIRTKDFINNAFKYQTLTNGLKVYISNAFHGREIKSMGRTYAKYRKTGQAGKASEQARKIKQRASKTPTYTQIAGWQIPTGNSTFFPQTVEDVEKLASVVTGRAYFYQEAHRQIKEQVNFNLKTIITLG